MAAPEFLHAPGPPWVLVSVSTLSQAGEVAIAQAAVRALRHENVRVAPDHAVELGELPDNVYLSGYVPHSAVLTGSRLIISHAGHGIVMKALYHGVPMVLVPWGRDQPGVARAPKPWVSRQLCRETRAMMRLWPEPCAKS
jgi:UDP:flavonoid glycosyltransferase YjiC (YdhE family)